MSRLLENSNNEKLALVRPLVAPTQDFELDDIGTDPLNDLLTEFQDYELPEEKPVLLVTPPRVHANQREDQMLVTLEGQLGSLREGLQRLHFYLSDVDDSIRR